MTRTLATLGLALILGFAPSVLAEPHSAAQPQPAQPEAAAERADSASTTLTMQPARVVPVSFVGQETFDLMCRAEQRGTLDELAQTFQLLSTCYNTYEQCQAECICGGGYDPYECRKICAGGCCSCVCP